VAHQSDHKKLLTIAAEKLCFECHDDLQKSIEKAPFKHDPTGNGECSACHNPHQSNEPGLLIKASAQVCYECHEEADMAKIEKHSAAKDKSCTACHDPHFGTDKLFLKPEAKQQ
jgi:predicted CXXCH cytochrome family protein